MVLKMPVRLVALQVEVDVEAVGVEAQFGIVTVVAKVAAVVVMMMDWRPNCACETSLVEPLLESSVAAVDYCSCCLCAMMHWTRTMVTNVIGNGDAGTAVAAVAALVACNRRAMR